MFETSFVEKAGRTSRPFTVSLSLVLQCAAVCVALAYPLFHIEPLSLPRLPTLPFHMRSVELVDTRPARPSQPTQGPVIPLRRQVSLVSPSRIPTEVAVLFESAELPDAGASPQGAGAWVPGLPGGTGGPAIEPPKPPPAKPKPVAAAPPPKGPVTIGGNVRPPRLITEVKPLYPQLARSARIQGTVRIEALIGRDGVVHSLRATSGHPLLVPAALEAVRQWRYEPTLLNNERVEVALAIDVNFRLGQ